MAGEVSTVPMTCSLDQNYPNPFNPSSRIRYQISQMSDVTLAVYDLLGHEVALLVNERKDPGTYLVSFEGEALASGVYFCRLVVRPSDAVVRNGSRTAVGTYTDVKKLVLLR